MENKYYIYLHINLITGLPFYVGKGTVLQYDKDNNFIKEFKTIKESQLETSSPHISKVCTGKRKTSGGFIWRYKNKEAKCTFN